MEKFFKRNGLSLRRRTTVSQRLPQDLIPKVTSFIMKTRRLRHSKEYPLSYIGNMDETPLWLDMPGETTRTGGRSVPIRTTGHDKGWMNEVLTKDWVDRVWGSLNFGRRLLVWDAYKCHIMDSVKNHVHNHTNMQRQRHPWWPD